MKTSFIISIGFLIFTCANGFSQGPEGGQWGQQQQQRPGMGGPPMGGGMGGEGGSAIAAADGYVFVVTRGKLYKFDDKTLRKLASVSLASGADGKEGGGGKGMPGSSGEGMQGPGQEGPPMGMQGSGQEGSPRGMQGGMGSMRGGGGVAISVSNGSIYVLYQGKLYRFDEKELKLLAAAQIEERSSSERPKPPSQGQ